MGWLLPPPMPPPGSRQESHPPQGSTQGWHPAGDGPLSRPHRPKGRCRASEGNCITTETWAGNKAREAQIGGKKKKKKKGNFYCLHIRQKKQFRVQITANKLLSKARNIRTYAKLATCLKLTTSPPPHFGLQNMPAVLPARGTSYIGTDRF